jgi:hypothetical protein
VEDRDQGKVAGLPGSLFVFEGNVVWLGGAALSLTCSLISRGSIYQWRRWGAGTRRVGCRSRTRLHSPQKEGLPMLSLRCLHQSSSCPSISAVFSGKSELSKLANLLKKHIMHLFPPISLQFSWAYGLKEI